MNIHIILKNFQTVKTFGRDIYEGKISIKEADEYKVDLLIENNFRKRTKLRSQEKKREKKIVLQNLYNFFEGRQKVLDAFESKIFFDKI